MERKLMIHRDTFEQYFQYTTLDGIVHQINHVSNIDVKRIAGVNYFTIDANDPGDPTQSVTLRMDRIKSFSWHGEKEEPEEEVPDGEIGMGEGEEDQNETNN